MPRTPHPMTAVSGALQDLRKALEGLVADHATMRQQLRSLVRNGSTPRGNGTGLAARRPKTSGGAKKRGRAFKFSEVQATEYRKQVEGGKSALALAKELKVSVPTMYSTLKRAGWTGRRGRPARAARAPARSGSSKKRGRAFKFTNDQAAELRKQVDGGKSALSLAKELKISLPTMYNTLRRAGWKGRRGRTAKAA